MGSSVSRFHWLLSRKRRRSQQRRFASQARPRQLAEFRHDEGLAPRQSRRLRISDCGLRIYVQRIRNPKLVEEVLAPRFVGATQVADDLTVHVKVVSLRTLQQPH